MTKNNIKTILFASLIATMILPFSMADYAVAEKQETNPKDKTWERLQEKNARYKVLEKMNSLYAEKDTLEKSDSITSEQKDRIDEIKNQLDEIDRQNHSKDIPQPQLKELIETQEKFEDEVITSPMLRYITSIGIDITSKEIQIGLNQNVVNSDNIDFIVYQLEQMMPENAKWHVVYSDTAESLSCNIVNCTPLIGGNLIYVEGSRGNCTYGFKVQKYGEWGWVTAGHCADGLTGAEVHDSQDRLVGTVAEERFDWGTSCDCAWVRTDSHLIDNKVFDESGLHTITKTTQASEQQNDTIMKVGHYGYITRGTVSAINVAVVDLTHWEFVKHLVRSDAHMSHGDSGGPIVERDDKGDLYGISTTHDPWGYYHTPIDMITAHLGVTVVVG